MNNLKIPALQKHAQETSPQDELIQKIPHRTLMIMNGDFMWNQEKLARSSTISTKINGKIIEYDMRRLSCDISIKRLSRAIKSHNWKTINMHIHCKEISNRDVKVLTTAIGRHLEQLRKLKLELEVYIPNRRDVTKIESYQSDIVKNLTKLNTLHFSLQYGTILESDIKNFGYEITRNMHQLKELSLSFIQCRATEKDLSVLGSEISRCFASLQSLKLLFPEELITDTVALQIFESRFGRNLSQLQRLDLTSCWSKLTEGGMKALVSGLERLSKLQELNLNLSCSSIINDSGLKVLGSGIKDHLTQLQQLSLDFERCKYITDKGVAVLGSEIGTYLNQLQCLGLGFERCERLTDKALDALAPEIGKLLNLKKLYLNFNSCQISDSGVKRLGSEVGMLTQLEQLNLQLTSSGFGMITNQSVEHMSKEVGKLNQLQWLSLNFGRCPQIKIDKLESLLLKNLVNLTKLKKLVLYLNCLNEISRNKHKELMHRFIPSLNL